MIYTYIVIILANLFLAETVLSAPRFAPQDPETEKLGEVSEVVNQKMHEVQLCYSNHYPNPQKYGGSLMLEITVDGWGDVSKMKLKEYNLKYKSKQLLKCLVQKIYKWKFPVNGLKAFSFKQPFEFNI
ncbi:MAG: AgmX/PglI C-terminal domain-containing protein [Oligoflexales bacterium]